MTTVPRPLDARVVAGTRAQLERRRETLDRGATPVGWKIGLNPPALLERLGLSQPVAGHLTSATLLAPGATFSIAGASDLRAEPEIAVEVGEDGGISALAPAIEVVDADRSPDELEQVLAENVFHRAVVLGPPAQGWLEGEGIVLVNGAERHRLDLVGPAAGLPDAVRVIGETLATCAERLTPGEWIITGSLTEPLPVQEGDEVALDLGPIGRVDLRFGP